MKKTYIIPATTTVVVNITSFMLSASQQPTLEIGEGQMSSFDVRSTSVSYSIWDDDWSDAGGE